MAHSTYYYWKKLKDKNKDFRCNRKYKGPSGYSLYDKGKKIRYEEIISIIKEVISGECSTYGYKKVTAHLRLQCKIKINKKKAYWLMKENDLLMLRNRKYTHKRWIDDREVERLNQMWVIDINYEYIEGSGRTFYIIKHKDVFTRELVGHYADYSISSKKAVRTLEKAIKEREINPLVLNFGSGNWSQFLNKEFEEYRNLRGIYHEFMHARCSEEKGYIKAYHGILDEELLSKSEFESLEEAKVTLIDWENSIIKGDYIGG